MEGYVPAEMNGVGLDMVVYAFLNLKKILKKMLKKLLFS
jgi:hypothetical protein